MASHSGTELPRTQDAVLEIWRAQQREISQQIIIPAYDESVPSIFQRALASQDHPETDHLVAGCDISFFPNNPARAVASVVVCRLYAPETVAWEHHEIVELTEPYIPQFLSFREIPGLMQVWDIMIRDAPDIFERILLVMVDGNGILHPRSLGIASHLGLVLQKPSIGCAKTLFHLPGFPSEKEVRAQVVKQNIPLHGFIPLCSSAHGDAIVGAAFRATADSLRPIYVSPGHLISLQDALNVVAKTTLFRIPEPVRKADLNGRQFIRKLEKPASPPKNVTKNQNKKPKQKT